jgi:ribosomal protein L11 methyltransferase
MQGTWIEVRVITKSEALEPISGIFYGLDCKGVAIEDPNDILGRDKGPLTWDFADINVLEHKGEVAVVKAYFSEEDDIEEILTYINEKIEELKNMGIDLGLGKVESEKMF